MTIAKVWRRRWAAVMLAALVALAAGVWGGSSSASNAHRASAGPIVIGASIPISGPLSSFGAFVKWGYQHAVNQINAAGGLKVGGTRRPVKLILLDDATDPNTTSNNVSQLISQDNVVGLLGSCTPPLVDAGALIAERHKIPMVTGCAPLEAFKSVTRWTHVWDIFFDEPDLTGLAFKLLSSKHVATNKKVAVLHDNGPDGQAEGKLWPIYAKQYGFTVVDNATFPTTATDFSSIIAQAKASGAQVVLTDSVTPQAVAMRKQMQASGFKPKVLEMDKGAEPLQFAQALGSLANGIMVGGYWDPTFPYPGAAKLRDTYQKQTGGTWSQHIADSDAAAQVLLDAITRAGSTNAEKINSAIAKTNKTYVVGPVKFRADHTSKLPLVLDQWQNGQSKVVYSPIPKLKPNAKFLFPIP